MCRGRLDSIVDLDGAEAVAAGRPQADDPGLNVADSAEAHLAR